MAFIRFAGVLSLIFAVGCQPTPPAPNALSREALEKLIPSVSEADNIAIVASSPTSSEMPTDFAVQVANALSERIASGGLSEGTHPNVQVHHTPEELPSDAQADVTLYFQVNDYQLDGEFDPDHAAVTEVFDAGSWIYSRGDDTPFTMSTGFDSNKKASGPEVEASSVPTWESFDYSRDPDERLQMFAGKCADSILKTFHELSSQLDQPK